MSGLYALAIPTVADDLQLENSFLLEAIQGPLRALVHYDAHTREIFVVDLGRIQVGERLDPEDNQHVHIERHLAGIHSESLLLQFFEVYGDRWNLDLDLLQEDHLDTEDDAPREAPSQASSSSSPRHNANELSAKEKPGARGSGLSRIGLQILDEQAGR